MGSKAYPWVRVRATWDQMHISLGKGKGNMGSKAYIPG